ncbi:hypothetical protein AKJ37_07385, partial [candidate division MSBL1 archaeon SCGC-AAA259I09]
FHSKNTRGIIYVHLRHEGEPHTVRFPWDAVLEEGEASEDAKRMRERRKLEESSRSEGERTELSKDIIVWKGTAKYPRGRRNKDGKEKKGATVTEAMNEDEESNEQEDSQEKEGSEEPQDDSDESEETSKKDGDKKERMSIASGTATPERIFKGSLEEAKKHPPVKRAFSILKEIFGGHYITSNTAESLFNVKPPLKAHRTMKNGNGFAQMLLFLRTKLRKKTRNEVVTYERVLKVSVSQLGPPPPDNQPEEVMLNAYRNHDPVTIIYKDRKGTKTSRMIEPLKIETDPYSGVRRIESYCYLRDAKRTFLLERMVDAIPANTELSVITKDSL